ncbi:PREDICTED: IGF-like family receptor 1 isoform X1 [Galeopterus variegatus]|uniref:IGF-like family receptor 1 isoform X1 n=1 Tax=Galeopterus variegatus TaxID=482537 RepID=A0ABM0QZW8_GALVR|nr:PREDICTED: IGF-like family receptor 1 isoform X1 [Galeopterus variegatus]
MVPGRLLTVVLLLTRAEASQYCGRLEYWNPDNKCCSKCSQRFGPPPCPDYEFVENCGLNDFGDLLTYPFKECSPGQCNPDGAELCSPCGSGATALTPTEGRGRSRRRCREVLVGLRRAKGLLERPVPTKKYCPLTSGKPSVPSSQEPSSPASSSLSWTSEHISRQALPSFALPVVLLLLLTLAVILLLALRRHLCLPSRKAVSLPYTGSVCGAPNTHSLSLHSLSPGALEASKTGNRWKEVSLLPLLSRESLASQPLSRLLDELEVLEELIVLLDPEPGPGGSMACGTTRHLAARYGLPAAWSTFAYSLRPSRSPLRALIEMVVAREPSASLGQLGAHLAQLGRADALQVLSKLGRSGVCQAN